MLCLAISLFGNDSERQRPERACGMALILVSMGRGEAPSACRAKIKLAAGSAKSNTRCMTTATLGATAINAREYVKGNPL